MSFCWKCGKELPDAQVECDPPCDEPSLSAMAEPLLLVTLAMKPRPEVLRDPELKAQFDRALRTWLHAIGFCFCEAGLNKLCSPPPKDF